MAESFAKKEKLKLKAKKKQEKAQKMLERKTDNDKGKSLEDMMAYVDEYGNITDKPPVPGAARKEINPDDILLGATPIVAEDKVRTGTILFFDESKGYGFISDDRTGERIFVHGSVLAVPVRERDKVSFEQEKTARGYSATQVTKLDANKSKN